MVNITNNEYAAPIDSDQRDKLKLSVKLFLCDWQAELIREAVDKGSLHSYYRYWVCLKRAVGFALLPRHLVKNHATPTYQVLIVMKLRLDHHVLGFV